MKTALPRFTYNDILEWKLPLYMAVYFPETWTGTVLDILDDKRIPFDDRLWVILRPELISERTMRLFAVWCIRQVQHLMTDQRSIAVIDVSERYANGKATREELVAALDAAWDVAMSPAWDADWYTTSDAAIDAAIDAARNAARDAAGVAAEDAQESKLRELILAELSAEK